MKSLNTLVSLAIVFCLTLSQQLKAQTIYTYENDVDGVFGTVAPGVSASDMVWINGPVFINACLDGMVSDTWSTDAGPFDLGFSAIEFSLTPDVGGSITVTGMQFDLRKNPQGPESMRYAYSTDGGATWVDQGFDMDIPTDDCNNGETNLWDMADFTTSTTVMFRIYGWNAGNVNGHQSTRNGFVYGTADCTATTWYADADGDGYGDAATSVEDCVMPAGYVADNTDCNDADAAINPGAAEICNAIDDNCDGSVDEGLVFETWYADADGDTYGDAAVSVSTCDGAPAGYVADNTDCNDADGAINPGAAEICNAIDDNCDGSVDEGLVFETWYADTDGDTYGDAAVSVSTCDGAPAGYVADATDCNDADAAINPAATEICGNDIDENCDGILDTEVTAEITVGSPAPVCAPLTVTLLSTFTDPSYTYQWYRNGVVIDGATGSSFDATAKRGDYQVMVSSGSCTDLSEIVPIRIYDPNPPVINNYGEFDLCADPPVHLKTTFGFAPTHYYQWYFNDVAIAGATTAKYEAFDAGSYYVKVYADYPGCEYFSEPVVLTADGCRYDNNILSSTDVNVYPNPTSGMVNVSVTSASVSNNAAVEIYNLLGELIYAEQLFLTNGEIEKAIDLYSITSNGIYTLKITIDNVSTTERFVIEK